MQITLRKIRPQSNLHILLVPFRCPLSHSSKKLYLNVSPISRSNDFQHVERFLIALVCIHERCLCKVKVVYGNLIELFLVQSRWGELISPHCLTICWEIQFLKSNYKLLQVQVKCFTRTSDEPLFLNGVAELGTVLNIWRPSFKAFAGLRTNLRLRVPASYFHNTAGLRTVSLF